MKRATVGAALRLLVVCFVVQEVVLRFVFPLPDVKGLNRINYMKVGLAGSEMKAIRSMRVLQENALDGVAMARTLNEYGFRGGRWEPHKAPGVARVFFVGDSFVEGGLTPDGETIPESFQTKAHERGVRVEVLNLGVNGAGLESELHLIVDAAPVLRPDVVFLVLYANDLPDDPVLPSPRHFGSYPTLKPRFLELLAMALNHEPLPCRQAWRTWRFLQPVPNPNNPWSDKDFEATYREMVSPAVLEAMRAGRFNPYRVGGSLYIEQSLLSPFDIRKALRDLREYLGQLGCRLLVLYVPERGMVTNYYKRFEREYSRGLPENVDLTQPPYQLHRRLLRDQCAELALPFLDVTELIRREEDAGRHLYFGYDDHLTGKGSSFVGAAVFHWFADSSTPLSHVPQGR